MHVPVIVPMFVPVLVPVLVPIPVPLLIPVPMTTKGDMAVIMTCDNDL